jgi:hypothetical protein
MPTNLLDRCEHLSELSGLNVVVRQEKNQNIYVFISPRGHEVSAYWTYKKAKAFAVGVAYGWFARGVERGHQRFPQPVKA